MYFYIENYFILQQVLKFSEEHNFQLNLKKKKEQLTF